MTSSKNLKFLLLLKSSQNLDANLPKPSRAPQKLQKPSKEVGWVILVLRRLLRCYHPNSTGRPLAHLLPIRVYLQIKNIMRYSPALLLIRDLLCVSTTKSQSPLTLPFLSHFEKFRSYFIQKPMDSVDPDL